MVRMDDESLHSREAQQQAEKTSTSSGEKAFDLLTYGGVAGLGTFALTIPVAYWAKYGKGAKYFEDAAKYLVKKGMRPRIAEEMVMTSALMQGGNLTIIPVKVLENCKPQIVDRFNHMLGDESGKASVDEDPQQTWGSLIKSRLVAWTAVFAGFRAAATLVGHEKLDSFEKKFAEGVCKLMGKATHIKGAETAHYRYGKIAALDVFATAAATSILYVGSRFFAKNNTHWDTDRNNPAPAATPPAPAAQPPAEAAPAGSFAEKNPRKQPVTAAPARPGSYAESVSTQRLETGKTPSLSA